MSQLFLKIVNMSISAGWLVLAVLLLRALLKKAPKWISVLLWGIVALRLLCPFSIESALSLVPSAQTIPAHIGMDATPAIDSGISAINRAVNPMLGRINTPAAGDSANPLQITLAIAAGVWVLGVAAMVLYTAVSYLRLRRKVHTAVLYRDNIFQSENVSSPFVLGVLRPKIYLPFHLAGQELEHVIAHEQAHLRRKDHWWKPLGFLLLAVHWFNPLMWLAYVLLCRDIELACDERVITALDNEQRANYTQALVACSVSRRRIAACPLAFGEVGVKERVRTIMNYKKPAFWIILISVIACAVLAVCFLTDPKQESYDIRIVVPAGSRARFVYSDEEISPTKSQILLTAGENLGDTEVVLLPVEVSQENAYDEAVYLTPGMPVKMDAEKGAWFKIGVNVQNPTEEDLVVYVNVDHVEVRISGENTAETILFRAKLLEIHDNYFLVEPEESSPEAASADRIEVPMAQMDSSLEPQVGDVLEIFHSGEVLETYPARLREVYSIRVAQESEAAGQYETDLIELFMEQLGDETTVVTDYVYAQDHAYGLDGVVQYSDGSGSPWNLAFLCDGVARPVRQDWEEADYIVASRLSYLGNGTVGVYIENTADRTVYECTMSFSRDAEAKDTTFKATSSEVNRELEPYRTDYIGDAPKVTAIAQKLPYPGGCTYASVALQTSEEPYELMVYLNGGGEAAGQEFRYCADIAFDLIGNAGLVTFLDAETEAVLASYDRYGTVSPQN